MKTIILIIMLTTIITAQTHFDEINQLVKSGKYSEATKMINEKLQSDQLSNEDIFQLRVRKRKIG